MPHIGSRFRNLVCPFKVSLCKVKPTSGSKVDHLGFLELASGTDPIVDIVAIHGLQGHRENTWMTDGGTLWLRDFLPADLSNARILTYGYDADTRSPECVSTQTMRRHAEGFAWALARTRRGNPRRPIIFLAHDLGCIILQWALALCHNQTLQSKCELRDILISTEAILFFGTPDFGIEVSLLEAISHLASMYIGAKDVMVKDLRSNSSELEDIQSRYVEASADINSTFLCGEYAAGSLDFSTSSNRNPAAIVLHASLRDMVKFSVKANDNYQTVLQYLKDYVENAVEDIKERWFTEDNRRSAAKEEPVSEVSMFPKSCPPAWRMYIERTHVQSLITQNLLPAQPTDRQPRCILHGIGGSGKTQLALKWIQEHETRFTRVIYVDASSKTQLEMDLKRSIRCLGLEYSKMSWKDAIAYLEGKEKGWLLFLDNADAPDLDLTPYIPKSTHGAVMLTTRNNKSVNYAPDGAVPVGPLEEAEALSLLHKVAEVTPASDAKSLEIVRELGMLALAITQAGVYIRATRRLEDYLDIFRKSRRRLLRRKPEFGSEYTSSTYTAFNLSFRKLKTKPQEFLKLCAFLHHSLIPLSLFERSVGSGFTTYTVLESCPPPKSDQRSISKLKAVFGETWDADGFQEIVDSASKASFIDVSTDGLFYTVHPLLQTYIKDSLVGLENEHYCRVTAQLILGAIRPPDGNNAQLWQLLPHANSIPRQVQSKDVAHVLAFYTLYDSLGSWTACRDLLQSAQAALQLIQDEGHEEPMYIDTKLAETLRSCGQWEEAEKLQRDLLARRLKVSGDRHPDTITAMNNLASILYSRGQLEEAETTQQKVLALRLEISGPRHSDAIVAMNNLAATLRGRGQLDEAEKMQRDVLALRLEISGPRHPDTIMAMNNLAWTLHGRGQLDEAEKMQRDALALRLEISGPRHPDTITAMNNLAWTLRGRGQLDEAEKMQRDVLALRLEISGPRHPDTIMAMNNLAATLRGRGQLDEAEKMQQDVLALRLETSGPRHPDTIMAMNNLAWTLHDRGQLDEAEKMQRDALALRLEISGPRHPDTIMAMNNLAATLCGRGQLDKAEKMQRDVLALRLEISGPRYPGTIAAMHCLAMTLRDRGQLDEAEKMQRDVLALRLEISGPRHPDTIMAMNNLAWTLRDRGQLDEAEKMQRDVLALWLEISGPRHPGTIMAMNNLAETLRGRGQLDEAEKMQRDVLALRLEFSGSGHPDTNTVINNLALILDNCGKTEEAERIRQDVRALQLQGSG